MTAVDWHYHHGGHVRTLVYLPGWASDARMLQRDLLNWNVIIPLAPLVNPASLDALPDFLHSLNGGAVAVLGWSLGGFLALDFARSHPDCVTRLFLASIRRHYPSAQVTALQTTLNEQPERALRSFYRQIFYPAQMRDYQRFRATLEPAYLQEFPLETLHAGLAYLGTAELAKTPPDCPIVCVHGEQDVLAPVVEAEQWARAVGAAWRLLPAAAHALPWDGDMYSILNDD